MATAKTRASAKNIDSTQEGTPIFIPAPDIRGLVLSLRGTAALIVHRFGDKAKKQMRGKRGKEATRTAKETKGPAEIAEDIAQCHYAVLGNEGMSPAEGRFGVTSISVKSAAVRAASMNTDMTMTETRMKFFVTGEVCPVRCRSIEPREDAVRVGRGLADLRYRPYYMDWETEVGIRYDANLISRNQIVNLFTLAGSNVGVGDWRPEKSGNNYGTWQVSGATEVSPEDLPDCKLAPEENDSPGSHLQCEGRKPASARRCGRSRPHPAPHDGGWSAVGRACIGGRQSTAITPTQALHLG